MILRFHLQLSLLGSKVVRAGELSATDVKASGMAQSGTLLGMMR